MSRIIRPPPLPGKAPRNRPILRWALSCLLLFILLAVFWYIAGRLRDSREVHRLEAEARKKGEPLTLAELARAYPPVPDPQNAAIVLIQLWAQEDPAYWSAFRAGRRPLPRRREHDYDPALPILGRGSVKPPGQEMAAGAIQAMGTFLQEQAVHLATVRSALALPRSRFPIKIEDGFAALFPHLSALETEARWLRIASLYAGDRGELEEALSSIEAIVRLSDLLTDEPISVSQLIRAKCQQHAIDALEDLLSRKPLSAEQIDRAQRLVESINPQKMIQRSFVGERAMVLSVFEMPAAVFADSAQSYTEGQSPKRDAAVYGLGMRFLAGIGLKLGDKRLMLETLSRALQLAEDGSPVSFPSVQELARATDRKLEGFPPKTFSRFMMPGVEKIFGRFLSLEARKRSALVALAIERFRFDHAEALPEKLDVLAGPYLAGVPKDPFNSEPLRYRRLTVGYVVYSVGADLRDNGGDKTLRTGTGRNLDDIFMVGRAVRPPL